MKVTLTKKFDFEAAHVQVEFPEGHKCRRMHGHTFNLSVSVTGPVDPKTGLFYDHAKISDAVRPLVDQLDHRYLNEIPGLENATIENITGWFWKNLKDELPGLSEITIGETPRVTCVYRGD